MAKNIEMQYYNGSSYEICYPKTLSTQVIMSDNTTVEAAITNLKTSVSEGKSAVASAITNMGVSTASSATFSTMATNIGKISTDANAGVAQILNGYTAYVGGKKITGTMANQGAKTSSLNCGGSYTIPAGWHNGSGKITANSLASQTSATATAAQIASGYTAWVNGSKITGTGTMYTSTQYSNTFAFANGAMPITLTYTISGSATYNKITMSSSAATFRIRNRDSDGAGSTQNVSMSAMNGTVLNNGATINILSYTYSGMTYTMTANLKNNVLTLKLSGSGGGYTYSLSTAVNLTITGTASL